MLAVDFDKRGTDRLQGLHADGLVIDEGSRATVGELHATQDHFTAVFQAIVGQDRHRRMGLRHVEHRRNLPLLGAVTHQARIAATAKRQRKGIEQDGFARAGLTGQDRKPLSEFDIKPFDQHDVADRQTRQHAR